MKKPKVLIFKNVVVRVEDVCAMAEELAKEDKFALMEAMHALIGDKVMDEEASSIALCCFAAGMYIGMRLPKKEVVQ